MARQAMAAPGRWTIDRPLDLADDCLGYGGGEVEFAMTGVLLRCLCMLLFVLPARAWPATPSSVGPAARPGQGIALLPIALSLSSLQLLPAAEAGLLSRLSSRMRLSLMMGVQFELGGDTIVGPESVLPTSADVEVLGGQDIRAGRGFSAVAGLLMSPIERGRHGIDVGLNLGFKVGVVLGTSSGATFKRLPIDAMVYYRYMPLSSDFLLRLGVGVEYQVGVFLSGHGGLEGVNQDVAGGQYRWANALGWVLETSIIRDGAGLSLRFGRVQYRPEDSFGQPLEVDGSYGGISMKWFFGDLGSGHPRRSAAVGMVSRAWRSSDSGNLSGRDEGLRRSPGVKRIKGSRIESEDPPEETSREGKVVVRGRMVGRVEEIGGDWVMVRSVTSKKTFLFVPKWKGEPGVGHYERRTLDQLRGIDVGHLVEILWYVDDRLRMRKIDRVELSL